jgi:exonuclease SbcC
VCGSIDHPRPAAGSGDIGRQREEAALHAWETAEAQQLAAHEVVLGARAKYDRAAEVSAGRTVEEWAADERDCSRALAEAEAAAQMLSTRRAELEELRARHAEQERELAGAQATLAQLEERLVRAQERARTSRVARDEARGDFPDLSGRRDHYQQRVRVLGSAREAVTALTLAQAALGEAEEGALRGATEAGFDSIDAVSLALLEPDALAVAEAEIATREDARRGAEAVLSSAEVRKALAERPADVPAAQEALTTAETEYARARARLEARRSARVRLEQLRTETTAALAAWRPLRADFDVADSLSTLAEGTSRENALRIRLSAYVLAERLRQVVDAANERLAVMTDQRYALEHTDERGVGAQKGGLSLRVRDDWTGVRRDPATLSGGETFVVSLALALGLADTVAHESGGVAIETLFIDEGFGTLDTETLDGVMDTLDGLRHNGRVIGVVSHVPELRERIPVGIEVEKARTGSRLAMR